MTAPPPAEPGGVHGHCDPAFRAVGDAFAENFARGDELGAAIAVYQGDDLVVDLWGGIADRHTGRAWRRDTPCVAFSCTKAVTAAAALRLAERGRYDLDGPVAGWWPEFAAHGKESTTAAHLLSHQAGLPVLDAPCTAEEAAGPGAMAARLAVQPPSWAPGTAHGYHALTYGWLAGEIVRRVAGRPVGEYVRDEFAGDLELWIGAPDEVIERAARLTARRPSAAAAADTGADTARAGAAPGDAGLRARVLNNLGDPNSLINRAMANPAAGKGGFNNPVVLRGGWPGAGMVATASALAGFYRDLVGGRILRPATLRAAIKPRVRGPDQVLIVDTAFGLGFMLPSVVFPMPPAAQHGAFGHTGTGGSIGFGDIDRGIAMAYVMNRLGDRLTGDLRAHRLIAALYEALS
ncbi:MAG TPA: serine hydrolase domain-containing protein [Streptosporangiaceae bacterium]|jgi:CubicO group peptidase (beta-lactamase class C family)|nr:serine hydrolase domain-containing protein [Streptosporangiaceae bacterium]